VTTSQLTLNRDVHFLVDQTAENAGWRFRSMLCRAGIFLLGRIFVFNPGYAWRCFDPHSRGTAKTAHLRFPQCRVEGSVAILLCRVRFVGSVLTI
jgi:hypothetical protein